MSSISGDGTPQSALVGIAISPDRDYLRHREVFPEIPLIWRSRRHPEPMTSVVFPLLVEKRPFADDDYP